MELDEIGGWVGGMVITAIVVLGFAVVGWAGWSLLYWL